MRQEKGQGNWDGIQQKYFNTSKICFDEVSEFNTTRHSFFEIKEKKQLKSCNSTYHLW